MFAGPNGSGKSTIIRYLLPHQIGIYLNADDLEQQLRLNQQLDLKTYHPFLSTPALLHFLKSKSKIKDGINIPLLSINPILVNTNTLQFDLVDIDSYLAARIIDYVRLEFLSLKISFTFETVMSHQSKIDFLAQAQAKGFRTYLYYVATVDPQINIGRVHYRVQTGGHVVPEHKIVERYHRSLSLLMSAVEHSDRSYFFDNSSNGQVASFLAEIEFAEVLKLNPKVAQYPRWFVEHILSEFSD